MAVIQEVRDILPESAVVFDNYAYDKSIIGVTDDDRAVYDFDSMIEELVEESGMTPEEAQEWIEYNTVRMLPYIGGNAPVIMYRLEV